MANPIIIDIPEWKWTKVATAVKTGFINRVFGVPSQRLLYFQTYRLTGETAPVDPSDKTVPGEAINIFDTCNQCLISSTHKIDVYVLCANNDDIEETGQVRVDL